MRRRNALVGLALLAGGASTGCFVGADPSFDGGGGAGLRPVSDRDREHYNALRRSLDEHRSEALGERADELSAAGNVLFWLDFSNFTPTLHSLTVEGTVAYDFGIGTGDRYNFRGSATAVATAKPLGDTVVYELYDRAAPRAPLGEAVFPRPSDEQRHFAYALDGAHLHVVTTGAETTLHRYDPQTDETTALVGLEAAGCEVGIFWDFGIEDDVMVFVESGRLWRLDLATQTCAFLGNTTEITGRVDFRADGALYEAYEGPFFYDALAGRTVDLAGAIAASGYALNASFERAHLWSYDVARWGRWVVYIGGVGVFGYHLDEDRVMPVLLVPIDEEVRVSYRHPVVLDDGTLFVTGLTSSSGTTGADGPVYRVSLRDVLR